MPLAKINDLGSVGLNLDLPPWEIQPNAISSGKNIRALQGRLRNFGGRVLNTTAPIQIYRIFGFQTPTRETLWLEGGLNQMYVYDGTNHTDLTRISGNYALDEYLDRWTGGVMNTMVGLSPGESGGLQQWTEIETTTKLVDMAYDPTAAPGFQTWEELNYSAYSLRTFKDVFVAMNLRRDTTDLPSTVQWSEVVVPGATTVDWVPRATNVAGEKQLGETSGNIIDGGRLRDDFILYKEDSAFRMTLIGGNEVFAFERLPDYVKIINRGCIGVAEEMHILASRDDVHIFDGNNFRSLLNQRMRKYYSESMCPERLFTTFVSVLNKEQEVWICFPSPCASSTEIKFPDRAIVWNYQDNTMSLTDLPQCRDMDQGVIVPDIPDAFDDTEPTDLTFDEDTARFDSSPFSTSLDFMVGAHEDKLSIFGESTTDDGTPRECLAERTGIVLVDEETGVDSIDGLYRTDEVFMYIDATSSVQVQVGGQLTSNGSVMWGSEKNFDPATQTHLKWRISGRYFGWRVRSNADVEWTVTAIEWKYHKVGGR